MSYQFIAYIFLSVIIGLSVCFKLFKTQRILAGFLTLILFILIFVFYGQRWFRGTDVIGTYTGSWPPIINTCPDYLIYYNRNGRDTCIDTLGVNRSNGVLRPWTKEDTPQNPPADDTKYFNYVYKAAMKPEEVKTLCNAAMATGLTWEGITNGESCVYMPPERVLAGASASTQSCPPTAEATAAATATATASATATSSGPRGQAYYQQEAMKAVAANDAKALQIVMEQQWQEIPESKKMIELMFQGKSIDFNQLLNQMKNMPPPPPPRR